MRVYETLTHCMSIEEEVDRKPWYYDIFQYVKNRQYVERIFENDKKTLRKMLMGFFSYREIWYKKGKYQMLLRYLETKKVRKVLEEVHERTYESHVTGHMTINQFMRVGYY